MNSADDKSARQEQVIYKGSNFDVIKTPSGVQGELYPCKPDIFEQTYERATETDDAGSKG